MFLGNIAHLLLFSSPLGSLTLHHWQQLAKPHLATILDPHPGVVTKGFRPLHQDKVYQLTDLEEDENQEKSSWERKSKEETTRCTKTDEEDEDDGGITFHVQLLSTPEEKRERSRVQTPTNVPPLPASLRNSPVPIAAVISIATAVNQTASSAVASGISGTVFPPLDLNLGCKAPSTGKLLLWKVIIWHSLQAVQGVLQILIDIESFIGLEVNPVCVQLFWL